MQERWDAGHLGGKFAYAGNPESQNSDGAIPAAHNFRRVKTIVKNALGMGMIETAAYLPSNIEQIPDGKPFFAGQHSSHAVALDVLHGSVELAVDHSGAKNWREVGVTQDLSGFRLFQETAL